MGGGRIVMGLLVQTRMVRKLLLRDVTRKGEIKIHCSIASCLLLFVVTLEPSCIRISNNSECTYVSKIFSFPRNLKHLRKPLENNVHNIGFIIKTPELLCRAYLLYTQAIQSIIHKVVFVGSASLCC